MADWPREPHPALRSFLKPLHMDSDLAHALSWNFCKTFKDLSAESTNQFLPTPISDSILRPSSGQEKGRYLAIDIGGSNLRVGFVELLGVDNQEAASEHSSSPRDNIQSPPRIRRALEKAWPILENLKHRNAEQLFAWIGLCIAEVVRDGCEAFGLARDVPLPIGVTFSFPMEQDTLSHATLMTMGKGFAISGNLDLGTHLISGYNKSRDSDLPEIQVAAILNDSVATLVSFIYQTREDATHRAAMGLICGTGSNATIALRKSALHPSKLPNKIKVLAGTAEDDVRVAVNTEWSINGTAPALHRLGLVSKWDTRLDLEGEAPGFQPLEYMTAGRYLGELGRLMLLEYLEVHEKLDLDLVPVALKQRFGLKTAFLSSLQADPGEARRKLESEFPLSTATGSFQWTDEIADALFHITMAIQNRAAGLVAAAIIGLLACAGDVELGPESGGGRNRKAQPAAAPTTRRTLSVGYTGGCISYFQNYLEDCQGFLNGILEVEFGGTAPIQVDLHPCHDGGITGAGVLCGLANPAEVERHLRGVGDVALPVERPAP